MATELNLKNILAAPRVLKVTVSSGTGSGVKRDPKRNELVLDRLGKIVGQKAVIKNAKKAIATFKTRQGDPVGVMATLRGKRAEAFLDKIIHVALPRTKDFRGIKRSAVDNMGNLAIGLKEHTIFPETSDEELRDVFGLSIMITTSAKDKKTAEKFFELMGVPFAKI